MGGVQQVRLALLLLICATVALVTLSSGSLRDVIPRVDLSEQDVPSPTTGSGVSIPRRTAASQNRTKPSYHGDISAGILSMRPTSFFQDLQREIDNNDNVERCLRYRFSGPNSPSTVKSTKKRRIFYGSLIADESWELLEIVAAETFGLFEAMVFVEGNRTQSFSPRQFKRLDHTKTLQDLFGIDRIQIRQFINEDKNVNGLSREHAQRDEIIKGWKELGMQPEDIGYLADADETFTRDFLQAILVCDDVPFLDYEKHHCIHHVAKMRAKTMVFESSPECVTQKRSWFHPDMIVGACIDGIGNETANPKAPRKPGSFHRREGFGSACRASGWAKESAIEDNRYHLWDASDFRRTCGGQFGILKPEEPQPGYSRYTGFHFHNFFSSANRIRFKYRTFGHGVSDAMTKPLGDMSNDLRLMYNCVMNITDDPEQHWKRIKGGFNELIRPLPIYFQDTSYRQTRHAVIQDIVATDEKERIANALVP